MGKRYEQTLQPRRYTSYKLVFEKMLSIICHWVHAQSLSGVWLCNPIDYRPPIFTVHGIFQSGRLEWVAISSSRGSSWPRDWTGVSWVSCVGRWILHHRATCETHHLWLVECKLEQQLNASTYLTKMIIFSKSEII